MKAFWALSVAFLVVSYITNGGFFGRRFARWQNYDTADRALFLSGAMLAGCAAAWLT